MYKFRANSRFSGNAEIVYMELEKIRDKNDGRLETKEVLKAAKKLKNPLNQYFEWDDTIAAEEFRLITARKIIKAVVYVEENTKSQQPVFINVMSVDSGQYYQNVSVATRDEFDVAILQLKGKILGITKNVKYIEQLAKTPKQKKTAKRIRGKTSEYSKSVQGLVR